MSLTTPHLADREGFGGSQILTWVGRVRVERFYHAFSGILASIIELAIFLLKPLGLTGPNAVANRRSRCRSAG